jgi:hypothetical protein
MFIPGIVQMPSQLMHFMYLPFIGVFNSLNDQITILMKTDIPQIFISHYISYFQLVLIPNLLLLQRALNWTTMNLRIP